jgi:hypothetical protein
MRRSAQREAEPLQKGRPAAVAKLAPGLLLIALAVAACGGSGTGDRTRGPVADRVQLAAAARIARRQAGMPVIQTRRRSPMSSDDRLQLSR